MNYIYDRDVQIYADSSRDATISGVVFFSLCTDINIFIEKLCQITCAESI